MMAVAEPPVERARAAALGPCGRALGCDEVEYNGDAGCLLWFSLTIQKWRLKSIIGHDHFQCPSPTDLGSPKD